MKQFTCIIICIFLFVLFANGRRLDTNNAVYQKLAEIGIPKSSFSFNFGMTRQPSKRIDAQQPPDVQTFRIPQKLDNFNPADTRTFLWVVFFSSRCKVF